MNELLIIFAFIFIFSIEEYRLNDKDIQIENLKEQLREAYNIPDSAGTITCVKCKHPNSVYIYHFKDTAK